MASGPTQNYDDASLGRWKARPVLALLVRGTVALLPVALAVAFGAAAARWFGPERLGVHPWLWLLVEVACAVLLLLGLARVLRRLLPLSTMLRLSLVMHDRAPSRLAVARRLYTPAALVESRRRRAGRSVPPPDDEAGRLLALVSALNAHDRTTFSHSARVQAYSALIGRELGLSREDVARLSWAALLHDVGKLEVPGALLTKSGRPTDEEWARLAEHPRHGVGLVLPLAGWLGDWAGAVGEHHERWDGAGYPAGLAGTDISLAARVVAVADAYDVITSARAYKKPLSAAAARAELTRCAGTQFDPDVVRAMLAVGLGRLRLVAGPASLLSALPGLRVVPWPEAVAGVPGLSAAATAAVVTTALVAWPALALAGPEAVAQEPTAVVVAQQAAGTGSGSPSRSGRDGTDGPASGGAGATDGPGATDGDDASTPSTAPDGEHAGRPERPVAPASPDGGTTTPDTDAAPSAAPPAAPAPGPTTPTPAGPAAPVAPVPAPSAAPPSSTPAEPTAAECQAARVGAVDMRGANLARCDLSGATLTGSWAGAKLDGADLRGATLVDLDLSGASLSGTDLRGATVTRTRFDTATLTGARFVDAVVSDSSFAGAVLDPRTLRGATVTGSTGLA
ncbi:HD domain-containing phosphohydrolase [Actinotalea solisilvae]|uniref:HD domain-containing phosphohydrolase n=1 Tax=Actinotalea solisilvae TaxID=2072922 RepID=UPI0018F1C75B|nr:HD domain-containing phosphohydrolase [Actinotalea solisilvae]